MQPNLPLSIISVADLIQVINELDDYSSNLYRSKIKAQVTKSKTSIKSLKDLSLESQSLIADWQKLNLGSLEKLIYYLNNLKKNSPKIIITLAATADSATKKMLADWCRNNLANNILIDFRFNKMLLGGMVVNFGSHIYDWSFRKQIVDQMTKLEEVLSSV